MVAVLSEEEVRGMLRLAEEAEEKSDRTVRAYWRGKAEAFRQVLEIEETGDSSSNSAEDDE